MPSQKYLSWDFLLWQGIGESFKIIGGRFLFIYFFFGCLQESSDYRQDYQLQTMPEDTTVQSSIPLI